MTNKRTLRSETFYHIYNRGYNKQTLFFEKSDFERFYKNIEKYKADEKFKNIKINAYCILPNHFHLLVYENKPGLESKFKPGLNFENKPGLFKEPGLEMKARCFSQKEPGLKDESNISAFMNRIQLSHAMYFNRKYEVLKKGLKSPIFEGRFKAKEITDEGYLSQVHTYIEYNAVKHEIVKKPEDWAFTSFDLAKSLKKDFDFEDSEFDPCFE